MTDASLGKWAEDLTAFGHGARLTSGADAAASGRAMLETALGGPEAVERAVRGRPVLASAINSSSIGIKSGKNAIFPSVLTKPSKDAPLDAGALGQRIWFGVVVIMP